jgi:hypothetical protein
MQKHAGGRISLFSPQHLCALLQNITDGLDWIGPDYK